MIAPTLATSLPDTIGDDYFVGTFHNAMSIENRIWHVYSCKAVIGFSSFETYLACALKKPVLEIQTSFGLYKWSNPNYFCISVLSSNSEHFPEILNKGVALCLSAIK